MSDYMFQPKLSVWHFLNEVFNTLTIPRTFNLFIL